MLQGKAIPKEVVQSVSQCWRQILLWKLLLRLTTRDLGLRILGTTLIQKVVKHLSCGSEATLNSHALTFSSFAWHPLRSNKITSCRSNKYDNAFATQLLTTLVHFWEWKIRLGKGRMKLMYPYMMPVKQCEYLYQRKGINNHEGAKLYFWISDINTG